jgi:hypothetical protein
MKPLLLILIIVFFCVNFTTAQKTISKENFESLVDYANCRYIMAFIEKNDVDSQYLTDTYSKEVKPELTKASLDNLGETPHFQIISQLLSKNERALKLAETINRRKENYENAQSDEELIIELKATKWYNIDLIPTAEVVLNLVFKKYKINSNISTQEIVQEQTIQTSTQVEQLQSSFNQLKQQYDKLSNENEIIEHQKALRSFKLIVLSIIIFLVILFVTVLVLWRIKLREYIIKQVLDSERIEKKFASKEMDPYTLSEKDLNIIADRVLECEMLTLNETQKDIKPEKTQNIIKSSKSEVKFLKGKSGTMFNRAENNPDNSFFKLFNESDGTAQFEFHGNDAEAIAKRIFSEDICIIVSGNYQNATSIKTSKPGKIKRVGEQWEVIEPIQIRLT